MKLHKISLIGSGIVLISMLFSVISIWQVKNAYDAANKAQEDRQNAMNTVNDFRLQMYQLNKLITAYISTAEPKYLLYYYDLLAIQDGTKAPPKLYKSSMYWDLVIAKKIIHEMPRNGEKLSVTTNMKQQKFSSDELNTLKNIFTITQKTKKIEQIAFAATQGLYDPKEKEFIEDGPINLKFASTLIYGKEYRILTSNLSQEIDKLVIQTDRRTHMTLVFASNTLSKWVLLAIVFITLTVLLTFGFILMVKKVILTPISKLTNATTNIAQGNYFFRVDPSHWLAELRQLGVTFNLMAEDIANDIANREKNRLELEEAKKTAEEATQAKSMFLANISHELRTPLNAIIGMSYLMTQTTLSVKQKEFIQHIDFAAKSLLEIIGDLLDFSKIEAGKMTLESAPFDLHLLLSNIIALHQYKADEKNIELRFEEKNIAEINNKFVMLGDSLRIGQVLNNLLSNALKFTEHGYVNVVCNAATIENQKLSITVVVQDSGIGMTSEQLTKLFQAFTQADNSITRKYGGTGLGLAISKQLVELMGGRLEIESQFGEGSIFTLNIILDIQQKDEIPFSTEKATNVKNSILKGLNVLLVEDNIVNQKILSALLHDFGTEVSIANNGEEALNILFQNKEDYFDIVLMDLNMPVLNGYEATIQIKNNPLYAHIPIVAMSAHVLIEEVVRCHIIGMEEYISKPIEPEMLFATLVRHFKANMQETVFEKLENEIEAINIIGLDTFKGLRYVQYDKKLYLDILQRFINDYAESEPTLQSYFNDHDFDLFARTIHSLKGLLGTIGADDMYEKAYLLEISLQNDVLTYPLVNSFTSALKELCLHIQSYFDQLQSINHPITTSDTSIEWLSNFKALLNENDYDAIETWESNKLSLLHKIGNEKIKALSKALAEFDFQNATILMKDLNL